MGLFRHQPSPREQEDYAGEVITSLELSGLAPETTLVLGGGALALAGIRRAHDVDVMVPRSIYADLLQHATSTGIYASPMEFANTRPFVTLHTSKLQLDALPVDVTVPHNPEGIPANEMDERFLRQLAQFNQVAGYRFMPPELVAKQKQQINRRKDRRDIRLIRQHLADHNNPGAA